MDSSQQQHVEDVEAIAPQSDENLSSSAIEEQPSRSYFNRRKKTVAAVVSIVAVAAIAVGVAVSVKPNKPADPEPATGVSGNNQDITVANDPLVEVSSSSANDEMPIFDPQDQEVVIAEGEIDDESQDIIVDMGYDAEHPADVIYDAGRAQAREPEEIDLARDPEEGGTPAEENVPFNSEDMAIELAQFKEDVPSLELTEFKGSLGDYIVTQDLARISTSSNGNCKNGQALLWLELMSDLYPWETSWSLQDKAGEILASGPPPNTNYARETKYQGRICMGPGRYNIVIRDKSADGVCCNYGDGSLKARVNGKMVAQTDDKPFAQKKWGFIIQPTQDQNSTPQPTPKPTPKPTRRPNPSSPKPTTKPTGDGQSINPASELYPVDIKVVTDKFASETGYKFVNVRNNEVIISKPVGQLQNEMTYESNLLLAPGRYRLEMEDGFRGIESPGYYSVTVDGQQVMYGMTWNTRESAQNNYIIRVGYEPPMTARDREWLDGHNNRRQEFHESQGAPFSELVWSPDLAESARNWVQEITPTCKLSREPQLIAGENMSARTSNGPRDEGPEAIMSRWADNKAGQSYPANQSMTQIYWRATRYVGCHDEVVTLNRNDKEILCYVSICRYARAGNCAMGQYNGDWLSATLADRSQCGPSCANNVCY